MTPANSRVAHVSLRGQIEANSFVEGEDHLVAVVVTDLLSAAGERDRQLLRGERFTVLDLHQGKAFGIARKDGYCGWLNPSDLLSAPHEAPTHRVAAARSYGKSTPGLKTMGRITPLPFGARLTVLGQSDGWAKIAWVRGTIPRDFHVPSRHLVPLDQLETDPVAVAQLFVGTPYLWGGNSTFGIDCSGLVQAALLACGIPCPGDSDMQQTLGAPATGAHCRGDLLFWKGHVAMVVDETQLIHANAHHMAVAFEGIDDAITRIESQGNGKVTARRRVVPG
nr:NlpC/P60 family protein [Aliiroseovarius subalbicans]